MEKTDVVPIILGAAVTAGLKGLDEQIYYANPTKYGGKFPYMGTINPLPPLDDWLFLAGSGVVYAIGHFAKKKTVKNLGLGALLFTGANFIRIIVIRSIRMTGYTFAINRYATVPIAPVKEI